MLNWFRKRRRAKILAKTWPSEWSLYLNRNVRLSWHLTESETLKLRSCVQIFVTEKNWEGCEGLVLTEEMRVTIAAQACLMLLGTENFYFDNVKTILVFPHSFSRQTTDGFLHGNTQHRSGEAWQGGPIVLSWRDALRGGRNEDDGSNVVIHEFAHALDGLDGEMGGSLIFPDQETSDRWSHVVDREFSELLAARDHGRETLIDYYAATNRAEFFAVATETFFEQPSQLKERHGELFQLLQEYFHIDPTDWQ